MKNKLDEIKSYIKGNKKKVGIAFLSLLGFCLIGSAAYYMNSLKDPSKEEIQLTLNQVKEEKQKEVDKETKKENAKEVTKSTKKDKEKAKKTEEKTSSRTDEAIKEEKAADKQEENKTIEIESQAQKSEEVKETKKNTTGTAKSTHQNKPVEVEKANTKVTETKPVETKPVEPKKDPNAGKVWKEAEYRTIQVPAVTERRWIVDETAYTEQVQVGEIIGASNGMKFNSINEFWAYMDTLPGEEYVKISYWTEPKYESVYHEEVGHWEDVVITPATTKQELVRPAGWY